MHRRVTVYGLYVCVSVIIVASSFISKQNIMHLIKASMGVFSWNLTQRLSFAKHWSRIEDIPVLLLSRIVVTLYTSIAIVVEVLAILFTI